jgi:hypothetical protein
MKMIYRRGVLLWRNNIFHPKTNKNLQIIPSLNENKKNTKYRQETLTYNAKVAPFETPMLLNRWKNQWLNAKTDNKLFTELWSYQY